MSKQSTTARNSTISNKTTEEKKTKKTKKMLGILNQQIARIKIENVKSTENINILTFMYESSNMRLKKTTITTNAIKEIYFLQKESKQTTTRGRLPRLSSWPKKRNKHKYTRAHTL